MPDLDFRTESPLSIFDEPQSSSPASAPNMSLMPQSEQDVGQSSEPQFTPGPADATSQFEAFQNWCEQPESTPEAGPAPQPVGLDSYDVVADDLVGPLGPNQIYQRQRDDLDNFNFGDFNVVGDDFVGPLSNDQVSQADYQTMQQAWLNMSDGNGMNITGAADDQEAFRDMMREGMTDSPTFRTMISEIGNDSDPAHLVEAAVGRSQPNVIGDNFGTNAIDLDDLDQFPAQAAEASPDQVTRNELLVHFLTERQNAQASANPADFTPAHQHGIDMQNQYRAERDQAQVLSQTGVRNADGTITATVAMDGGVNETWDIDNTQAITGVTAAH